MLVDSIKVNSLLDKCKAEKALYLVATPIGNLLDMSLRAIKILDSVDIIYCEDTRVTSKLLSVYGICSKLSVYHDHSDHKVRRNIIDQILLHDKSIALVSDAGTPLINDPGYKLVKECCENNIKVFSIPGPCSPVVALTLSQMPSDKFMFAGFLESKSNARKKQFSDMLRHGVTLIFFESPKRIEKSLCDLMEIAGNEIRVSLCRELTKRYEEVIHGTVKDVIEKLKDKTGNIKGEIVLVIDAAKSGFSLEGVVEDGREKGYTEHERLVNEIRDMLAKGIRVKDVANFVAQKFSKSKRDMYRLALDIVTTTKTR